MSKFAVLYVQQFDFKDDSGSTVKGCQIHFFDPAVRVNSRTEAGFPLMNLFTKDFSIDDFDIIPAYYNLDVRQRRGAKGKMASYLHDFEFISPMGKADVNDESSVA